MDKCDIEFVLIDICVLGLLLGSIAFLCIYPEWYHSEFDNETQIVNEDETCIYYVSYFGNNHLSDRMKEIEDKGGVIINIQSRPDYSDSTKEVYWMKEKA